ncbi:hypothetical protein Tco_0893691 [Tanacetum coccineum]|uniref:Uncharacterized protein n=1 Tax=Tanacetum coccineum TaxID=301880 RepID=A0ABQ5CFV7_9ASTR
MLGEVEERHCVAKVLPYANAGIICHWHLACFALWQMAAAAAAHFACLLLCDWRLFWLVQLPQLFWLAKHVALACCAICCYALDLPIVVHVRIACFVWVAIADLHAMHFAALVYLLACWLFVAGVAFCAANSRHFGQWPVFAHCQLRAAFVRCKLAAILCAGCSNFGMCLLACVLCLGAGCLHWPNFFFGCCCCCCNGCLLAVMLLLLLLLALPVAAGGSLLALICKCTLGACLAIAGISALFAAMHRGFLLANCAVKQLAFCC